MANDLDLGKNIHIGGGSVGSSPDYILFLTDNKGIMPLTDYDVIKIENLSSSLSLIKEQAMN